MCVSSFQRGYEIRCPPRPNGLKGTFLRGAPNVFLVLRDRPVRLSPWARGED